MELDSIHIRNFRSFWSEDNAPSLDMKLCNSANFIAGPNNCGKSNVLRAVALALQGDDSGKQFNRDLDLPAHMNFAVPSITLQFRLTDNSNSSPEATLKRRTHEYEKSVEGVKKGKTNAEQNILRYNVQYRVSAGSAPSRIEGLQAAGVGARRGDKELLEAALDQFHKTVRLIYIKSGEDLSSALAGGLTEVLCNVLQNQLKQQMQEATVQREQYVTHLADTLLQPLAEHLGKELGHICPEIQKASIMPHVPELEETLARATINVLDSCEAPLAEKGTGVRGALLVALMDYIARQSKRTVIFALEEPESFLHPSAQDGLFNVLIGLAKRPNVSLIVTTHSPFFLAHKGEGQVTVLHKDNKGKTSASVPLSNGDSRIPALAPLFSNLIMPTLLDTAFFRAEAKGVLVVEGYTDKQYFLLAAKKCGRTDLIDDLDIVCAEGAAMAGHRAITLKAMLGTEKPLFLLLDYDEPGKDMLKRLTDEKFKFQKNKNIGDYRRWVADGGKDVEAEDLFPESLMAHFEAQFGSAALSEKMQRHPAGWHIGLNQAGKDKFVPFLEAHASAEDFALWVKALEDIRSMMKIKPAN